MKLWSVCLFLVIGAAYAQPNAMLVRLNGNLTNLKSLPAIADEAALSGLSSLTGGDPEVFRKTVAGSEPDFYRAANWITVDISHLHYPYPGDFRTWKLAYALTRVLAGKTLSEDREAPLTEAIAGVVASAVDCRANLTRLLDSTQFQNSMEQAYKALIALNVSVPNTRVMMGLLYRSVDPMARRGSRSVPMYPNYK